MKISFRTIFHLFLARSYGYALEKELYLAQKANFHIHNAYF